MTKQSLAKNTTYLTVALAIQKLLAFVYFIFVARGIGVENTGRYSFALSFTTIFAMFLDFGLTQILIREAARNRENSQKYLANVIGLKLIGSVIVYGAIVLAVNLMGYPEITRQLVYVSGLVMIIDSFSLSFFGTLRGCQNLKYESAGVVLNQLAVLLIGLLVLKLQLGLVVLIGVFLVGSLVNFLISFSALRFKYKIKPQIRFNLQIIKHLLVLALPFGIAGFFIRIYSSIDIVLLSKLADDKAVGIYSVAYKIAFALQFVGVAFSASVFPAFAHCFVSSKEELAKTFTKSMYFLGVLASPIAVGLIMLSDKIIGPVFGAAYIASSSPLKIFMLALIFIFLCFPATAILNACNRHTRNTVHLGVIALVNTVLNLILIPIFSYNGAAFATLFTYILLFGLSMAVVGQIINYDKKYLILSFGKIILSCVLMGILIALLNNYWHFIFIIPVAAIFYFLVLFLMKGLVKEDFFQLRSLLFKK
ncbi:MAG: flippase [Patescibacteria group bacterium]